MTVPEPKANKSLIRPIAFIAAISGTIQGVAWFIMSVLAICCYYKVIAAPVLTLNSDFGVIIYYSFLNTDVPSLGVVLSHEAFVIFSFFYMVLSVIWLIISCYVLWATKRNKWANSAHGFVSWSIFTILISLLDVILMSLIAYDYQNLLLLTIEPVSVAYGIVMTIAARGYLLWIINVIFAITLLKFASNIKADNRHQNSLSRPIINGYESSSNIYPPWFRDPTSNDPWISNTNPTAPTGQGNPLMSNDGRNPEIERSQSFLPVVIPANRVNNPHYYDNQERQNFNWNFNPTSSNLYVDNNKMKNKRPTNEPTSPIIPDPDYTPPTSPNYLKSVLRTKSNY